MTALTPAQQALLAARLRGKAIAPRSAPPPQRSAPTLSAPLSAEQEQLYLHSRFQPNHPLYNEAVFISKTGPLDVPALQEAVNLFIARHDIWHTTFRRKDGSLQQVVEPFVGLEVPLHDLSGLSPSKQRVTVSEIVATEAVRPYALAVGPLVRPLIIRYDEGTHRLYLGLHHIIFDGVSLYRVVFPELVALYTAVSEGRSPQLPAVSTQYADYALWQQSGALDERLATHLPYWRSQLGGAPTMNLPTIIERSDDHPRHGTMLGFTVPAATVAVARSVAASTDATLLHVLVAAYSRLLQLVTGDDEVVFATVADLRRRAEFETMVGYCLTPLPLRIRSSRLASFDSLIRLVKEELLDGLEHVLPFERIVRDLQPTPVPGSSPIFQAMFVLEPQEASTIEGWELHQLDPDIGGAMGAAKMDFHMELDERSDGQLAGRFAFNTNLFSADFGRQVVAAFMEILAQLQLPPAQPPQQRQSTN